MSFHALFSFSSSSLGPGSVVRETRQNAGWKCKKTVERGGPSGGLERGKGDGRLPCLPLARAFSRGWLRSPLEMESPARELLPLPSLPLCSLRSPIFFAFFAHYGAWSQNTLLDPAPLTFRGTSDGLSGKDTNRLPEPPPLYLHPYSTNAT